jgi:hypothetical protein
MKGLRDKRMKGLRVKGEKVMGRKGERGGAWRAEVRLLIPGHTSYM